MERTGEGRPLTRRIVVDEDLREGLAMDVRRRFKAADVHEGWGELFRRRGCPGHLRSDHGPAFLARSLRQGFAQLQIAPLFMEPGSPGENGSVESFNGTFREEWLNRARFSTRREAPGVIGRWRRTDNQAGPTARGAIGLQRPSP